MIVGLVQEFYLSPLPTGVGKTLQGGDDLRPVILRLFEENAGHAHGDLEFRMGLKKFCKKVGSRKVALIRHLVENFPILLLPEELVPFRVEPERLVELKIDGQQRHGGTMFVLSIGAVSPVFPCVGTALPER